jgi:hypothetical protein
MIFFTFCNRKQDFYCVSETHNTSPAVLTTEARAPVALHLARLFDGGGWRVVMAKNGPPITGPSVGNGVLF